MFAVFIFIGISLLASGLCLFLPPVVPGIASMTASLAAILAFVLVRMRERTPDTEVVRVDGVTLDSRGEVGRRTDSADATTDELAERLEEEKKRGAALRTELDLASGRMESLASSAAGMNSRIEEITSSFRETDTAPTLRAAISNLEIAMRLADGLEESVARQSEELSETYDTLIKRRTGESIIDPTAGTGEEKALGGMASTLEELCENSNVIAVNGAIEAARIGKGGKGFSVIAGEMQNFAGQAKNLADEFRAFRRLYTERRNGEKDKTAALRKREQTLQGAVDKAATITMGLAEDVNRLIAAGPSGELDALSKCVESEIEARQKVIDQLTRLLKSTE